MSYWRPLAEQGNAAVQFNLGAIMTTALAFHGTTVRLSWNAPKDGCDSTLCGLWWGFGERGKPDYGDDETE